MSTGIKDVFTCNLCLVRALPSLPGPATCILVQAIILIVAFVADVPDVLARVLYVDVFSVAVGTLLALKNI